MIRYYCDKCGKELNENLEDYFEVIMHSMFHLKTSCIFCKDCFKNRGPKSKTILNVSFMHENMSDYIKPIYHKYGAIGTRCYTCFTRDHYNSKKLRWERFTVGEVIKDICFNEGHDIQNMRNAGSRVLDVVKRILLNENLIEYDKKDDNKLVPCLAYGLYTKEIECDSGTTEQ